MTSQTMSLIATHFCWYPSKSIRDLAHAVEFESKRLGMSHAAANLFLASCLQAVRQLERGNLRIGRDFRQIALARSECLLELRFSFRADSESLARLYFTQVSELIMSIGLLLRVKSLDGDRGQIRATQNSNISEAIEFLRIAKVEKFSKCLQEGE